MLHALEQTITSESKKVERNHDARAPLGAKLLSPGREAGVRLEAKRAPERRGDTLLIVATTVKGC